MQIRLTVVDPPAPGAEGRSRAASRDVLVTAPAGTGLSAVASALAASVPGHDGPVVLYAGAERLAPQRCTLGEPPLIDGAVLRLGAPDEPEPHPELDDAPARLHVVAGPDAGGVHLLHGGPVQVGRSAGADVPLDDPDVSRLHCAVTLGADGRVTVADLGSTNGTLLDGVPVEGRPVRFAPGSLLRIGESALRLAPAAGPGARVPTTPDGEGHVRVPCGDGGGPDGHDAAPSVPADHAHASASGAARSHGTAPTPPPVPERTGDPGGTGRAGPPSGGATRPASPGAGPDTHGAGLDIRHASAAGRAALGALPLDDADTGDATRPGTPPPHGSGAPQRRRGLTAWARRLAGARGAPEPAAPRTPGTGPTDRTVLRPAAPGVPEVWPDPAALLLTALGPGPRLWERGPGHPEALTVRLGTTDRTAPDGSGMLPAVPVTAGLREAGGLGLAGPRPRLSGLARAVVAQLAALHSPDILEIVLISVDRSRSLQERTAEWSWLGWLPHLRPGHGQDCRLLLAHDREQAAARTDELLHRLAEVTERDAAGAGASVPRPASGAPAPTAGTSPESSSAPRRPSWARPDDGADPAPTAFPGPYTVVVVDGDPGGPGLHEAVARLAAEGPRAGIHVVCLAETDPVSPASPVAETYRAACEASPTFGECGAVALLSGDVATTLRLLRVARGTPVPVGNGTLATVDAVSPAWAERFARALAPLRPDGPTEQHARVAAPLPQSARLLDELGLARATPSSLMARWADAADDTDALGGRARAVLGAGPRGPVGVDLVADGPHLLVEGPQGSGRTELLRSVVASLAAAERPDRLGVVLMDGRDRVGDPGEGLRVCTDVPHVTTHLIASDPVRMREFAQSLSAELKRRAELLGRSDFAEWHRHRAVSGRIVAQRTPETSRASSPARTAGSASAPSAGSGGTAVTPAAASGDIETPPSSTIRLRPAAAGRQPETPPLPRLVVVVDDLDALASPALGSPGRPAAGSVMRALEAVAREGERLGVHLVAATGPGGRTAETEPARRADLRVVLDAPGSGSDDPAPGRGRLTGSDGRATPFQAGRVTSRIPRTATLRPTVVALEWHRMGDPPARRPVRELGNGPTDLALLASALERAAREVSAAQVPSLL
ncbi:FHA domain-containing protein [Streptomyces actuosus]|uniref:FHA domain-containing protein n=1 Tax=Streptomyces actuosus TaxID=1885 RepID=A0ABS2VS36_STRAS|nr:FtsK/SpoIIIE domain-containing protein [Streptomyces actuosus]MBN0045901.1 FHA domain-containing protein [Streptomyces actuosus]